MKIGCLRVRVRDRWNLFFAKGWGEAQYPHAQNNIHLFENKTWVCVYIARLHALYMYVPVCDS
jgi:hypothetical protein